MAPVQRGKLKPVDEQKIKQNYVDICKIIESQDLTPHLFAKGVIDEDDKELINTKATRNNRAMALVDRILNAGRDNNFNLFIMILKESYPDLAEQIENTQVAEDLTNASLNLPESFLNVLVTDVAASRISSYIGTGWQHLMLQLKLNQIKVDREKQHSGDGTTQTITNLIIHWRRKNGRAATWGSLWRVLEQVNDEGLTMVDMAAVREVALRENQS